MIRRTALATVAVTVAASILSWTAGSAGASAAVTTPPADHSVGLPTGTYSDMLVDPAAGALLVAGANGVAVSALDGSGMQLIATQGSAQKLALGPDGLVYVTESIGQIQAIDPVARTIQQTWPTGHAGCPYAIAFAGNDLWFSYTCDPDLGQGGNTYGVAHLDRTDGTVVRNLVHSSRTELVAVPGRTDELLAAGATDVGELSLISVSGSSATISAQSSDLGFLPHIAVSADGSTALFVSRSNVSGYSTTDLTATGPNLNASIMDGIAVSPDGTHLALSSSEQPQLVTYDYPAETAVHSYPLPSGYDAPNHPATDGLAWSGDTLLAVFIDSSDGNPVLRVLNTALQHPSALSFTGPATAIRTSRISLTGQLPGLASAPVTISKRDLSGTRTIGTTTTDANGRFSLADAPGVGGTNTYTASYAGDQTHQAIARSVAVTVSRQTVPMSIGLDHSSYSYHQIAHLAIHVAAHNGRTVQVWAKFGHEPLHLLRTLTLDSKGVARMDSMLTYDTLYQLRFPGDYVYNARTISTTALTRVAIASVVGGQYAMSGAYHLFHSGGLAYVAAKVAPDKSGGCIRFESQRLTSGGWVNSVSLSCAPIESGLAAAGFRGSAGVGYRLRAIYNTEATNLGNSTGYQYVMFR